MIELMHSFQQYTLAVCFWAFGILFAFVVLATTGALNDIARRWCGMSPFGRCFVVASVAFMTLTGATKSIFSFDNGIKSRGQNYTTNNTVHVEWQRDVSQGILVPTDAPVYIDCRLSTDTNGVWSSLGESTVGAWAWEGTIANATNYDINVWAYYIPPEPVHTNGVWIYKTLRDRSDTYPIPLRSRIEIDGRAIATPKEKRKDYGND